MSDEKDNKFKVLEFKKNKEEEQVPKFAVEMIEKLLEKAKNGQLKNLVLHFNYIEDDISNKHEGGTLFWNETGNPVETLGLVEMIKSFALDLAFGAMSGEEE